MNEQPLLTVGHMGQAIALRTNQTGLGVLVPPIDDWTFSHGDATIRVVRKRSFRAEWRYDIGRIAAGSSIVIDGDSETVGEPIEPDLDVWAPWRPEDVARRLAGVSVPWYIAGGWAIDLFLGAEHRAHEDIEIGVPRDRFSEVASALGEFEFFVVGTPDGLAWPFAARADVRSEHHQTWVREPASGRWRLDIFREPAEGNMWICRRDTRIRLPYDRLIARAADGIPYARPEIVLLFKAKAARPNDENDFAVSLPYLDLDARGWLADALNLVHPGHHWLTKLR